jgi:hypothetical protein
MRLDAVLRAMQEMAEDLVHEDCGRTVELGDQGWQSFVVLQEERT